MAAFFSMLGGFLAKLASNLVALFGAYKLGQKSAENEALTEHAKRTKAANEARNDPEYRDPYLRD
jgi:hypothetical protein